MTKHDEEFTKIAVKLGMGVRDLFEWGIEKGVTTADKLRLTVAARKVEAKRLVEGGASQREAAKAVGISKSQLNRDVSPKGTEMSQRGTTKAERRAKRELELATKQTALPTKRYGVIVADPEWRFEPYSRETGMDRAADNHYPTSITEIGRAHV